MLRLQVLILSFSFLLIGCAGSTESNEDETQEATNTVTEKPADERAEVNEDLLPGLLEMDIQGENYSVTEFDKRRSEITYTDDATMVRLTSLDKEQSIQVLFQNIDLSTPKPFDVSLNAQDDDKVAYTFQGFLGPKDSVSSTVIFDGLSSIKRFDESSREFEATFQGTAFHLQLIGKKKDTVEVIGKIKVQLDHDVDTRKK